MLDLHRSTVCASMLDALRHGAFDAREYLLGCSHIIRATGTHQTAPGLSRPIVSKLGDDLVGHHAP